MARFSHLLSPIFMDTLTIPRILFRRVLRTLAQNSLRTIWLTLGLAEKYAVREWLARDLLVSTPNAAGHQPILRVRLSDNLDVAYLGLSRAQHEGELVLGLGREIGNWLGVIATEQELVPLEELYLIGSGMHRVDGITVLPTFLVAPNVERARERWSRTIGALGGENIWQRLTLLRIGVVGCGRSGSLAALGLARSGIAHLTLIDPDTIEIHNLGEMEGVGDADLGRPKAQALAANLQAALSGSTLTLNAIVSAISEPAALMAASQCDVIFCCADNDGARLATAMLATFYHRVLIDIGTGIQLNPVGEARRARQMGADVRLIVPGDGCLLCRGGLTQYASAVAELTDVRAQAAQPADWREHRAGSLHALNQVAAGLGVLMLQDLTAERVSTSLWAHLEFDANGILRTEYPSLPPHDSNVCTLCARAGLGDAALGMSLADTSATS